MVIKLQWQDASDLGVKGWYEYNEYNIRTKVSNGRLVYLKSKMTPVVVNTNIMTLGGYIKETIYYRK